MTAFVFRIFFLGLFVLLFFRTELVARRSQDLSPGTFKEFINWSSKWRKGSSPEGSALCFATLFFGIFSLWENLIVSVLGLLPWLQVSLWAGVVSAGFLFRRRRAYHAWTHREFAWALGTLGLICGAFFCWVLYPWPYFRAQFLKKR